MFLQPVLLRIHWYSRLLPSTQTSYSFFFFNDPPTPEIYPLPLPDALPFSPRSETRRRYRLVRALAAGSLLEEVAVDRLARQRQARPADQIIHVGLSDDDDVEGAGVHRMTLLKHYIPVGKLSGGSSGVQRSTRSSGSTARVRSRWTMASNWSATRTLK